MERVARRVIIRFTMDAINNNSNLKSNQTLSFQILHGLNLRPSQSNIFCPPPMTLIFCFFARKAIKNHTTIGILKEKKEMTTITKGKTC